MKGVVICAGILVAGCSSILEYNSAPSPTRVAEYVTEIAHATKGIAGLTPEDYFHAGIGYTNRSCDTFFDNLTRLQDDSKFINAAITSAIASGSSLIAAFEAGKVATKTVPILTASLASANLLNNTVADIYFFAKYGGSLRAQVRSQMGTHYREILADNQVFGRIRNEGPESATAWLLARSVVESYAQLCSVTNIHQIVETKLAERPADLAAKPPPPDEDATKKMKRHGKRSDRERMDNRPDPVPRSTLVPNFW